MNADDQTLIAVAYGEAVELEVDVSGLDVDPICARKLVFDAPETIRLELLAAGCAELVGSEADAAELAAQQTAQSEGAGRWHPGFFAKIARAWSSFLEWISRNRDDVLTWLGLAIGVLGIGWTTKTIERVLRSRHEKSIHVILIGAASAGKTDLWISWRDDSAPRSDSAPTVGITRAERLAPVPYGKYTLYPSVTDTAGSEPWRLVEQLKRSHWRSKRVLVIVVSPRAQNSTDGTLASAFDREYVSEQKGYMNLPRAVLGGGDRRARPHLVVLFASKFDLLSDFEARDSNSSEARQSVATSFAEHRRLVETACKKSNIPFVWIIGSAKKGWGIQELRESIRTVVTM